MGPGAGGWRNGNAQTCREKGQLPGLTPPLLDTCLIVGLPLWPLEGSSPSLSCCRNILWSLRILIFISHFLVGKWLVFRAFGMCGLAGPTPPFLLFPGEGHRREGVHGAPFHPLTLLLCVLHSLRLPPSGRCWQNLQPNHWPVSLQGRRDRHHLQPLCQRLPAEPLPHRPLHKYVGACSWGLGCGWRACLEVGPAIQECS